jgi:hypothetical protein
MALDLLTSFGFLDLLSRLDLALLDLLTDNLLLLVLLDDLSNFLNTVNTLTATLIGLNQANSNIQIHVDSEDVVNYFNHLIRLLHLQSLLISGLDKLDLLVKSHFWLRLFIFSLLLLFLLAATLLFLFLATSVNGFLKEDFDFDNAGVVLEIEQKLIQVHV